MRVTAAAATMVAQVRLAGGIRELANAQTMTWQAIHRCRPGFRRPAPKKVCSQCGPQRRTCVGGHRIHQSPSSSGISCLTASSASVTGDEITYPPLAHLPRSIWRQWSLQKGKSGSVPWSPLADGAAEPMVLLRGIIIAEVRGQIAEVKNVCANWFSPLHLTLTSDLRRSPPPIIIVGGCDAAAVELPLFGFTSLG